MGSPSTSLATLRPDLAGSFREFDLDANQQGFIFTQVLPAITPAKQSGTFGKIPVEQLLKERDTTRAPGSGYARSSFEFTTDSYACVEHGAEEPVDDRESAMYADYFDAEQVAASRARHAVMINAEKRVAAAVFNATTWASFKTAVTNEWDDAANATPVDDVKTAKQAVWDQTGIWPNVMIMNRTVFNNLRVVDEIQALSQSQNFMDVRQGAITEAALGIVFDLRLIVAGSARDSAKEGQTTSIAPVWSNEFCMIGRVAESNDIREPCIGRLFHWTEDGSQLMGTTESYREEQVRADIVRVRHDVDEKILYVEAGHLLENITT